MKTLGPSLSHIFLDEDSEEFRRFPREEVFFFLAGVLLTAFGECSLSLRETVFFPLALVP